MLKENTHWKHTEVQSVDLNDVSSIFMFLLHKNQKRRFQGFIIDPLLLQGCLYESMVDAKTQEVFIINALFYQVFSI